MSCTTNAAQELRNPNSASLHPAEAMQAEPRVAKIRKHHVYSGAKRGSLRGVYVQLAYDDGSTSGRGAFEAAEDLCGRLECVEVLADYLRTPHGGAIAKYMPKYLLDEVELWEQAEKDALQPSSEVNDIHACTRLGELLEQLGGQAGLVEGWSCKVVTRRAGASAGTKDRYFINPAGRRYRSMKEVARHFGLETM